MKMQHLKFLLWGYETQVFAVNGKLSINISLAVSTKQLDEMIVQAYGTTTRRLNTGNITRVSGADIEKQPVSNPLAALQGRVPGLLISQTTGVPGSSFTVEIRGKTNLDLGLSRNDPLFVIDGVPFEAGNLPISQIPSSANNPNSISEGGLSPLNSINPADIESIEVLKDADATAIYGSRGANGVILITTKKGKAGKTKVTVNMYTGLSNVTRTMGLLNTQQYVAMRREAFLQDGTAMTITNAPDVLVWDTTRYTDLKELLIGNQATSTDIQTSISGGNASTQFLVGGGYHRETNVYSSELSDRRGSVLFNVNHSSPDKKFNVSFHGNYSSDKNQLLNTDMTRYINLPPNLMLYDAAGNLAWQEKGVNFSSVGSAINPLSALQRKYSSNTSHVSGRSLFSYKILKTLLAKITIGYTDRRSDETSMSPRSSIAPSSSALASASFSNSYDKSWIIEPRAEYNVNIKRLKISALLGGSWQGRENKGTLINATNYTNDLLLNSPNGAGVVTATDRFFQYRYVAFFGRANINWDDKYIVNVSARRDGSSRFGPEKQFANFGAVGLAWIFSNELFIQKRSGFLSYGKLRGSYGITGNDQINDYKFYDLWNNTTTYQSNPGFAPEALFNPGYNWETNKKFEIGLELGFVKDRILFLSSYYRQRSGNQLISYNLPSQTGFSSIIRNQPALVENSGIELSLVTKNFSAKNLTWTSSVSLSVPKNRLISFPGLESSSYANNYQEGKSLTVIYGYRFLGVDPATGVYQFEDLDKDGLITSSNDKQFLGNIDPKFYAGLQNSISFNNFQFDIFFEFRNQIGTNYQGIFFTYVPGGPTNQPMLVLDRWQKPGDVAIVQRYTNSVTSAAAIGSRTRLVASDGIYSDASFVRLKNLALAYNVPEESLRRIKVESFRFYISAQNLATFTDYIGSDPETQNINRLPPLRTIVAGMQLTF